MAPLTADRAVALLARSPRQQRSSCGRRRPPPHPLSGLEFEARLALNNLAARFRPVHVDFNALTGALHRLGYVPGQHRNERPRIAACGRRAVSRRCALAVLHAQGVSRRPAGDFLGADGGGLTGLTPGPPGTP